MNEANINYSHTYPINEEPNWVDEDLAVDESVLSESEFDLPEPEVEVGSQQLIVNKLDELAGYVSDLNQQFSDRLSRDAAKEKAFDHLYGELETVKQDSSFERFKPLYLDLILLFDRLDRCRVENTAVSGEELYNFLLTLKEELLEVLYRQSIELVSSDGNSFDATKQRAIATETTTVKAENNQLAEIVRRGFRYQNRLLRPEEVIVKKFRG